jgi:hypothetical protein
MRSDQQQTSLHGRAAARYSSVVRAHRCADNATSGPLNILWNVPQAQAAGFSRGGEAKEEPPTRMLAKSVCKRSVGGGQRW